MSACVCGSLFVITHVCVCECSSLFVSTRVCVCSFTYVTVFIPLSNVSLLLMVCRAQQSHNTRRLTNLRNQEVTFGKWGRSLSCTSNVYGEFPFSLDLVLEVLGRGRCRKALHQSSLPETGPAKKRTEGRREEGMLGVVSLCFTPRWREGDL